MNNLYTYVNHNFQTIDNLAQELPTNWRNIQGLNLLSNAELEDLTDFGHPGFGWVPLATYDLSTYTAAPEWLALSKNNVKAIIQRGRLEQEALTFTYSGYQFRGDPETLNSISFKLLNTQGDPSATFVWRFLNGDFTISGTQLASVATFLNDYLQDCMDLDSAKVAEIDACTDAAGLGALDLDVLYPVIPIV